MRWLFVAFIALAASQAVAEPYRLRADVYSTAGPNAGLMVLQGEDIERPWLYAEALVWTGTEGVADALVATVQLRDPQQRGQLRLGRFLMSTGAVRPVHMDGVSALGRLPRWGTNVEVFGGTPVVAKLASQAYDWLVGARVSQAIGKRGTVGLSYYHRRDEGALADEEAGVDFAAMPYEWLDLAGLASYDLVSPGISDAQLSTALRRGNVRLELFAGRRSPARILPATSLFSALGDVPSDSMGASVRWRMFPRLDVLATGAARRYGDDSGGEGSAKVLLRLDDTGAGVLALEARRQDIPFAAWTGVRATARVPVGARVGISAEGELVFPDDPRGRGEAWPWGLVAVTWRPIDRWEIAVAVEGGASSEQTSQVQGLLRLTRRWEP